MPNKPGSSQITVEGTWILVCTYQRNEMLAQLLDSLAAVRLPADSSLTAPQVIIVDNAPERAAAQTVAEHLPSAVYLHQPVPGISSARNASLDAVPQDAQAVIFIDDDEYVPSHWLSAMIDTANATGADAVTGPVLPVFEEGEPEWLANYGFVRKLEHPEGPYRRRPATHNSLVRFEWFAERGMRFDEMFNFTGGEDSDLFERMQRAGAKYWWTKDVLIYETIPADRSTQAWLHQRASRGGYVRTLKIRRRLPGPVVPLRIAGEGVLRLGYSAARVSAKKLRRKPVTFKDHYYWHEGLGMISALAGRRRIEYARPDAQPE